MLAGYKGVGRGRPPLSGLNGLKKAAKTVLKPSLTSVVKSGTDLGDGTKRRPGRPKGSFKISPGRAEFNGGDDSSGGMGGSGVEKVISTPAEKLELAIERLGRKRRIMEAKALKIRYMAEEKANRLRQVSGVVCNVSLI